ncbi:hypothetical protein DOJK_00809 [Patescibacteria group bacterium]|nr:hypothetical protein [Candidatus Dojkabacteria bacterium]CAG1021138.1 hypothetical protein DOJK_00809 [Patescibacteria group bacterium]
MLNDVNPVTKQLWIFSFLVSLVISGLINFLAIELLKGSFLYGFPIKLDDAVGIGSFIARLINSVLLGAILTPLLYYVIKYLQTRVRI